MKKCIIPRTCKTQTKTGTHALNVLKKLGIALVPNQAPGNPGGLLSEGIQPNGNSSTYSVAKNISAPNDDIKALQHSLNVLAFTDRDGKKL